MNYSLILYMIIDDVWMNYHCIIVLYASYYAFLYDLFCEFFYELFIEL